ncbi:hypothetical protein [Bosea psychrotolerans]|uniref:hypothetical protein n=1 Tax=Bosea psychrotolerans TaxID=1871628 RepID=UPI0011B0660A|nr:hypothetical protein [Bosea psychrotolerans]
MTATTGRRAERERDCYRAPLSAGSVHEIASLCPRRPAWLDTPAVASRLPGAPSQAERPRELFQWADRLRNQPGRPAASP